MSYSLFSTDNADYALVYALHTIQTKEDIFEKGRIESLDAIVLENSGLEFKDITNGDKVSGVDQYNQILASSHDAGKPIYHVDVSSTWLGRICGLMGIFLAGYVGYRCIKSTAKGIKPRGAGKTTFDRRGFLKLAGKGIIGGFVATAIPGAYILPYIDGESNDIVPAASSVLTNIMPTPWIALRNAITARKVEEYVTPLLKARLKRKPKIALVYGSLHAGIESCIKEKWWRDRIIGFSRITGDIGVRKEQLNNVYEVLPSDVFTGDTKVIGLWWDVRSYNCGLF